MSDWATLGMSDPHNDWTALVVNPADLNQPPEGPYIEIRHDGDPWWNNPWNWTLYLKPPTGRYGEWHKHGCRMTKLGAKRAALKAWRQHLKRQRNKARGPEIIKLRPPSAG